MGTRLSSPQKPSNSSVLEDLSNDLLLEVFDYFWSHEIHLSFGDLNSRFESLINDYPQHVNLRLSAIIPYHIRSLQLNGKYQLPLFFAFDHRQRSLIRSLTLANLPSQQMLDVLNAVDVKRLEYVYLGEDYNLREWIGDKESVKVRVLSLGEHRLHRCHLRGCLTNIDRLPSTLPALTYLHLESCKDFSVLSSLLSCLPNLKFLQSSIATSTENPLQSVCCPMTHLVLRPHRNCSTIEIDKFLGSCCSHVKKLVVEVVIENGEPGSFLMSKRQWSTIIPRRVRWFHSKAIPFSLNNNLLRNFQSTTLYDRIRSMGNEPCEVIVDAPFLFKW